MAQFLRITDYAKATNTPRIMSVVRSLYDNGSIMARDIPFAVRKSLYVNGARFDGPLPAVKWVDINDLDLTGDHTTVKTFQEQAYLARMEIFTDKELLDDESSFINPHAFSVEAYLQSFAFDFNNKFFNGKHTGTGGDPRSIVGLRERLDNPAKYGTLAANKINGGGVDISASATASSFGKFFELLDEMLWRLNSPDGNDVVIYVPHPFMWQINGLARRLSGQGGFGQATDQLGRMVTSYHGAQIRSPGLKTDQSSAILTQTETAAGADGASTFSSIYGVRYGRNGLTGWTKTPLDAIDSPKNEPTHKGTLIHWSGGIMIPDSKAVARIYNIKTS